MKIDRGDVVPIVVAAVIIAGMGMAAATLTSAQPVGDDGQTTYYEPPHPLEEIGPDNELGEGERHQNQSVMETDGQYSTITMCVEPLDTPLGLLGTLGGFLVLVFLTYHRFNIAIALLTAWTIFPPIMLVYFLLTDCSVGEDLVSGDQSGFGAAPAFVGESLAPAADLPVWIVPILGLTVLVGAALVFYRSATVDEEIVIPEDDLEDDDPDLDRFARAAGRAADRIEEHNADPDNAVYQAWTEMTGFLNVEKPETYTAGEFATAAINLGMAEPDVDELTLLFNEVRYGGKDATTRADRAVDVLRNIEEQYRDYAAEHEELAEDPGDELTGTSDTEDDSEEGH